MGTYRQPGQQANFFNPAQDVLVGIESVEKDVTGRLKTVRDFENAAAVRRADMLKALADTEGMDDMGAVDSLQASLMEQVDDLYKLDIASFEGDRSEYLRKQNETNNIVSSIPALMGLIDDEGEKFKEAENSGTDFIKQILKTNNQDYVDFVQNASRGGDKVSFRIQNGNIIAQLNGKDVFNGTAYIKAKKDGVDLVNYAGDYSKEIGEADKQAYQNLDNLVKVQSIQKEIAKGTKLNTQQIKDYTEARAEYIKRLEEGVLVDALLNESTYQTWTNYGTGKDSDSLDAWKNDEMQRAATKQAIIDHMVKQRFPGSGKYVEKEVEKEALTPIQKLKIEEDEKERKNALKIAKIKATEEASQKVKLNEQDIKQFQRNERIAQEIKKYFPQWKEEKTAKFFAKMLNKYDISEGDKSKEYRTASNVTGAPEEDANKIYVSKFVKGVKEFLPLEIDFDDEDSVLRLLNEAVGLTGETQSNLMKYYHEDYDIYTNKKGKIVYKDNSSKPKGY